ncbi:hypothetical protein JTB14_034069 [Gonioctena quinquepunctata]|nr:hypothetical protein JTB14_034069 [Gonioctena quinquepunctata]
MAAKQQKHQRKGTVNTIESPIPVASTSSEESSTSISVNKILSQDITKAISETKMQMICNKYTNIEREPSPSSDAKHNTQSPWTKVEHEKHKKAKIKPFGG